MQKGSQLKKYSGKKSERLPSDVISVDDLMPGLKPRYNYELVDAETDILFRRARFGY